MRDTPNARAFLSNGCVHTVFGLTQDQPALEDTAIFILRVGTVSLAQASLGTFMFCIRMFDGCSHTFQPRICVFYTRGARSFYRTSLTLFLSTSPRNARFSTLCDRTLEGYWAAMLQVYRAEVLKTSGIGQNSYNWLEGIFYSRACRFPSPLGSDSLALRSVSGRLDGCALIVSINQWGDHGRTPRPKY